MLGINEGGDGGNGEKRRGQKAEWELKRGNEESGTAYKGTWRPEILEMDAAKTAPPPSLELNGSWHCH